MSRDPFPQWVELNLSGLNRPVGPPRSKSVMLPKTATPANRQQRRLLARMQRRQKTRPAE